jgi:hypothetical protein
MNEWLHGNGQIKRKAKVSGKEEIDEVVWEWFTNARPKKNSHIWQNGPKRSSRSSHISGMTSSKCLQDG